MSGEDITGHGLKGEASPEHDGWYRSLFETSQDSIFLVDRETGDILAANEAACRLYGYREEEFLRMKHTSLSAEPEKTGAAVRDSVLSVPLRYHRKKDGTVFPVEIAGSYFVDHGRSLHTAFIRDITQRTRMERALRESEERWQFALEGTGDGVWDWNAVSNHVYYSPRWKAIFGYAEDEMRDTLDEWDRRIHPDDRARVFDDLDRHLRGETAYYQNEHRLLCKDGSYKWILDRGKVIEWTGDGKPRRMIGTSSDIADRKEMEETLAEGRERLKGIMFSVADWIWEVDENGVYTYSSQKGTDFFGRSRNDIIGKTPFDFMPPDEAERVGAIFAGIKANKAPIKDLENWNIGSNGELRCLVTNGVPILDGEGNLRGYRGVDKDITDRKKAEEQIRSLLAEKELLLREVHHRIKNNMYVIMSLLSLQSGTEGENPSVVAALQDARSRIQSMMLLYEKIYYRSSDFRKVSTREYITSLTDEILSNFPNYRLVTVRTEVADFLLDATILSPVGMILNELLTNAMKHAFAVRNGGRLYVSLSRRGRHVKLSVRDNGAGIPESVDIAGSTGFGLQVVKLLTEQLEGVIRLERRKGSVFILEFDV